MTFTAGQRLLASQLDANMPQLLGSTVLATSQPSITIAIPSGFGFNHLNAVYTARCDAGTTQFLIVRFNGDTGSNYAWEQSAGQTTTAQIANSAGLVAFIRAGVCPSAGDTANYFGCGSFSVGNISSSVFKPMSGQFTALQGTTAGWAGTVGGVWQSTTAVTSVTLQSVSGNLVANSSMSVYGWG